MDHLFQECPVSMTIRTELLFQKLLQEPNMEFLQWLTWVFSQNNISLCRLFCCALWAIWGERNNRLHKKVSRSGKEIANFFQSYISEVDGNEKETQKITQEVSKRKHPPDQTVKINFDAAYDETSSQAALGIVVRNSEGKALISCSEIHHQIGSAFAAEALACHRVVQIGMEMKWSKIIIEGDSLSIIKKCKENREDKSHIGAYIHDIEQIMYRSRNLTFAYIPRVANMLAHLLAKESMKKREEIYLVDSFPEYAEFQRVNDSVREPD
ncbi:uncharacterized protein LOC128283833 [Gossypium arboreum]|uniref:uncharacterized protein LOC128283833 n=1 Tax=Gossypium arboreum TaxID=29729 RepID=UPI0022F1A971|nr:uncharacterized protein LOC128283833 [Gossypium arboreum]